jgi:hypothetical protein
MKMLKATTPWSGVVHFGITPMLSPEKMAVVNKRARGRYADFHPDSGD